MAWLGVSARAEVTPPRTVVKRRIRRAPIFRTLLAHFNGMIDML
jgi:hypothetical protein